LEKTSGCENCVLQGYYAASSGNFLLKFWDILLVSSSRVSTPVRIYRMEINIEFKLNSVKLMTTVAITQQIAVAAVHTSAFKRYIVTN
jgi:hypothetical protein